MLLYKRYVVYDKTITITYTVRTVNRSERTEILTTIFNHTTVCKTMLELMDDYKNFPTIDVNILYFIPSDFNLLIKTKM